MHPDFYNTAPEPDKSNSIKYSALLKTAYDVLMHPYQRAIYLLEIIKEKPTAAALQPDFDWLAKILEIQEKLEQIDSKQENLKYITEIEQWKAISQNGVEQKFEKYFSEPSEIIYEQLVKEVGKLKFLLNIEQRIEELS